MVERPGGTRSIHRRKVEKGSVRTAVSAATSHASARRARARSRRSSRNPSTIQWRLPDRNQPSRVQVGEQRLEIGFRALAVHLVLGHERGQDLPDGPTSLDELPDADAGVGQAVVDAVVQPEDDDLVAESRRDLTLRCNDRRVQWKARGHRSTLAQLRHETPAARAP